MLPVTCFIRRQRLSEPIGDDLGGFGYSALSYTWGTPSFTEGVMICGLKVKVTKNLYAALKQLRYRHQFCSVWIDQVCINQTNTEEKFGQIRIIKDIYSSSSRVVVWLGSADASAKQALRFAHTFLDTVYQFNAPDMMATDHHLRGGVGDLLHTNKCKMFRETKHPQFRRFMPNTRSVPRYWSSKTSDRGSVLRHLTGRAPYLWLPQRDHQEWQSFKALFSRPWFSRIWIIQEVAVGKRIEVFCGEERLDWLFLVLLADALHCHVPPLFFGPEVEADGGLPLNGVRAIEKIRAASSFDIPGCSGRSLSMFELVIRHQRFKATEPSDHIIALEGLAAEAWSLGPGQSTQELYIATALIFLQQTGALPSDRGIFFARNLLDDPEAMSAVPINRAG